MHIKLSSNNFASLNYFDHNKRDILLILPGGGYAYASDREGKPVANTFSEMGLHTCIYQYRETLLTYPEIHEEALELLKILKKDPLIQHIHVIGFSAGGHLALMLLEKYNNYFSSGILCYPVISTDKMLYHGESFKRLTNNNLNDEILQELSLEKHVHKDMPPIFIFHTMNDGSVPVGNAIVLAKALHEQSVAVELHLFPNGRHGVSIATEEVAFGDNTSTHFIAHYGYLNEWVHLAKKFIKRNMI